MTTQTLRYLVRLLCLETMGKSGGKALDGGAELLKRIKAAQDQGGAVYSPLALWPGALRVPLLAIEVLPWFSASMSLVKGKAAEMLTPQGAQGILRTSSQPGAILAENPHKKDRPGA